MIFVRSEHSEPLSCRCRNSKWRGCMFTAAEQGCVRESCVTRTHSVQQQPAQEQTWQLEPPASDWCFAFLPALHLSLIVNRRYRSETNTKGSQAGTCSEPTKIYGVKQKQIMERSAKTPLRVSLNVQVVALLARLPPSPPHNQRARHHSILDSFFHRH
jgi:hypothetical protein